MHYGIGVLQESRADPLCALCKRCSFAPYVPRNKCKGKRREQFKGIKGIRKPISLLGFLSHSKGV